MLNHLVFQYVFIHVMFIAVSHKSFNGTRQQRLRQRSRTKMSSTQSVCKMILMIQFLESHQIQHIRKRKRQEVNAHEVQVDHIEVVHPIEKEMPEGQGANREQK